MHKILDTILASYVACQNNDSLENVTLTLGTATKEVNLKVPCFFIIGDMQGGDKMCCSAPVYMDKINCLCCKCDVKGTATKEVNLKVPCFFIIGDMQGGDKMCCSAPVYMDKINRLCRKCDVKGSDSGDPFVQCQKIVSS